MSGRFAGSKSFDERRRRRIASEDAGASGEAASAVTDGASDRPLPTRRPTARFPLQRVVSRSTWKPALVGVAALAGCGGAVAAGQLPAVQAGAWGPGAATFFSAESGRLLPTAAGLLLIVTGQFAWLVRWARARSLRDFRGGYRIWWWTALACVLAGVVVLTDGPSALAATLAWATGKRPFGSDVAYRVGPPLAALLLLVPILQRDMRGCRTSRTLALIASLLWVATAAAIAFEPSLAAALGQAGATVGTGVVTEGLLLAGAVSAFTSLLFHARHVVYESVEPPDPPKKRVKAKAEATETDAATAEKAEPKRTTRRKTKSEAKTKEVEKAAEEPKAPAAKPHVLLKNPVLTKPAEPPKPAPQPAAAKPEPPKAETPKPAPAKPAPQPAPQPAKVESRRNDAEEDWSEAGDTAESADGRNVRLDGGHDPYKGLSKRERRKLRKAGKLHDQDGGDDGDD